jgi:hypothetical protein
MWSCDVKEARLVIWEQEIAGSNPARPTSADLQLGYSDCLLILHLGYR